MRRLSTCALLPLLLATAWSGAGAAATITGTQGADRLNGGSRADEIYGLAGNDRLSGNAGDDLIHAGSGRDSVSGGLGDDRLAVQADAAPDRVACGPGRDIVNAEAIDRVAADCEVVSVQLGRDPYRNRNSQHETQVEPDSFSFERTIVTAFQSGRFLGGGASGIGFATSSDGGRTWRSGFLPGLTLFTSPSGIHDVVSDPAVAYDAAHGVWLIASLGVSENLTELLVSRSADGVNWSLPVTAARTVGGDLAYDKEWIACDSWPASRFFGRCYLSYTDVRGERLATQTSTDGGLRWSTAASPLAPGSQPHEVSGAQPVVRPDGTLVVVHVNRSGIAASRSTDGGATFSGSVTVTPLTAARVTEFRAPALPSVEVDASGTLYASWHTCRFRPTCTFNDLAFTSSPDGASWAPPTRVPLGGTSSTVGRIIPGLGVDPTTSGARARLALAYHSHAGSRFDVQLVSSTDGGATWSRPQRLTARSMELSWIADTRSGRMLGDYISTSFSTGRPVPVFSLASPRTATTFKQAIFATTPRR
ncbi:MAG: exo-alpha-sialidase [Actinobacteria bacterium]|nr:exo-alpha-sialidase [Actinomycetota bacterium]